MYEIKLRQTSKSISIEFMFKTNPPALAKATAD